MIAIGLVSALGGTGRTSLSCELTQALSALGRQVLLIQADPSNLLPHQLGHPEWASTGLIQSLRGTHSLSETIREVSPGLQLLPFGQSELANTHAMGMEMLKNPEKFASIFSDPCLTENHILLFDTPRFPSAWSTAVMGLTDLNLVLMVPDAQSLLSIDSTIEGLLRARGVSYFLMNRFESTHVLHLDVWTLAKVKLTHRLLPFYMHEDQALPEAFATGQPLSEYAPSSQLAEDLQKLAIWLDGEMS